MKQFSTNIHLHCIYLYLILFLFKFMLCARTCRTFIHGHNIKTCQWNSNNSKATDNRCLTIVCSTTIRVSYPNFFKTDDCANIIFFFEGQSLIKLNIYNPYVGTCGRQQGGFFLCCWHDMHHRLINITQGGEELNRTKNVPWGGRGEKYKETWCILTTYRSQIFLVLKCSYVGRCFGENVFWTHDLRRLHGVSIGRNPYPCRPMAWISFAFECNWSSLVWLWAKQKQTAKAVNTNTTLNHAVLTFDNWCKESCFLLMASL